MNHSVNKTMNFTAAYPQISEQVKNLALRDYSYFRTANFDRMTIEIKEMLLDLTRASNHNVAILTASGTGAMNAAVIGLIPRESRVLVIRGGRFGDLWKELCDAYDLEVVTYDLKPGTRIDNARLEELITEHSPGVVLMQHNETSTMCSYDIKAVGRICKEHSTLLFVDACSSLAIDTINVDDYNLDVLVSSSQKGLLVPAGLAFVIYSKSLPVNTKTHYFNLGSYAKESGRFIQPFTPPVITMHQLHYQLELIKKTGLDNWIKVIQDRAEYFRRICAPLQGRIVSEVSSNCGTVIDFGRSDNSSFIEDLQRKGIYLVNSRGWWGDFISVGHIGNIEKEDYEILTREMEKWLSTKQ